MKPSVGPYGVRCDECFGPVANPVNDEPVQKVNKSANTDIPKSQPTPTPEEPKLSDPTAQKIVEAAQNYARAIEAVKIINEQLLGARELVTALEKQLKGNQDIASAAADELRKATVKTT